MPHSHTTLSMPVYAFFYQSKRIDGVFAYVYLVETRTEKRFPASELMPVNPGKLQWCTKNTFMTILKQRSIVMI